MTEGSAGPTVEDLERSRYFLTEWMPPLLRFTAERSPPEWLGGAVKHAEVLTAGAQQCTGTARLDPWLPRRAEGV